jgi:hypothetical protein
MEEKAKSSTSNALTYGLITGAVMIVYSLLLYLLNLHLNQNLGYISFLILIAGMAYGTVQFRNKDMNGFITYGRAYSSSFKIALFAGILAAVYAFLFYQFIAPDVVREILDMANQKIMAKSAQMSDDQMQKAMDMTAKFVSPALMSIFLLIYCIIVAAIVGLITSIFIKKEDKTANPIV